MEKTVNIHDAKTHLSSLVAEAEAGEEIVIADGGRGSAAQLQAAGQPVEWVAPEEGAMAWVCGLAITADAENIPAAYKLINYFVSPPAQAMIAQAGLTVVNPEAMAEVPRSVRASADPGSLTGVIPEVQPDNYQSWVRAWQEVKAGGLAARGAPPAASRPLSING